MIDFELTEEQKMLQRTAREFAEKEMRPIAEEIDADPDPDAALRTKEVIMKGLRLGFGKLLIPERYGGYGGSLVDWSIIQEEFGWGDPGISILFVNANSVPRLINIGGTEKQKEKWLRYICEDKNGDIIVTGCFTEPTGGSELFCPLPDPEIGVRTTAVRDGNHYIINGTKSFITGPTIAKIATVLARTDTTKPNLEGLSVFLVFTDTPGFKIGKSENKMGNRTAHCCEVTFEDMRIPAEDLLGAENAGAPIMLQTFRGNGIGIGAIAVGLARAVYEEALAYAKERKIWGKPLCQYEHVATKLVDMATKIVAMRTTIWLLAWAAEHPEKAQGIEKLCGMAKPFPTSMIRGITADAFQIMGAYAYMKPSLVERYVRDAMVMPVYDTANEVLTSIVAQELFQ